MRKYGTSTTITFELYQRDGVALAPGAVHASGDTKIIKDEGANANTTNGFVDETIGMYSIALTATEMQAARVAVVIVDQTSPKAWMDTVLIIETYADASSQHEVFPVDVVKISGDSSAADNAEAMFDGAGYAGGTIKLDVNATSIANNAITANVIANDAITAAKIATGAIDADAIADNAIDAGSIAADAITAAKVSADVVSEIQSGLGTVANQTTIIGLIDTEIASILAAVDTEVFAIHAATADIQSRIPASLVSGRIDSNVGAMAANVLTSTAIANDAITDAKIAVPSAPTGVETRVLARMMQVWRRMFKKSTLSTSQLITYADDGSTPVTTQAVSDSGTLQTLGEAS